MTDSLTPKRDVATDPNFWNGLKIAVMESDGTEMMTELPAKTEVLEERDRCAKLLERAATHFRMKIRRNNEIGREHGNMWDDRSFNNFVEFVEFLAAHIRKGPQ